MDWWNKKKVEELQKELENRTLTIASLHKRIKTLEEALNGERVCGKACKKCVHGMKIEYTDYYICELNVKCKDFKKKD